MKVLVKKFFDSLGYSVLKKSTLEKYIGNTDPYKTQANLIGKKENPCIFDVGAHYGETTSIYKGLFPEARIYAFEPFAESAEIFLQNTKMYSEVKFFECAFSNLAGESEFFINASDATNSLLNSTVTNSWIDDVTKNYRTLMVKTETIDGFCEINNIEKIDILKLDVQGGEKLVLEGAINMLSSNKINMIFTEVEFIEIYKNQPLFHDITSFLAKYDYKLFGLYQTHCLENGQIAWCDAIYIKTK
jgi:FkbM family methyltransferase